MKTFKENIAKKTASMLIEHVNLNRNTNAFDEDQYLRRCKRMNKCNSWLTNYPITNQ